MDDREKIVEEVTKRMFPGELSSIDDIEKRYPPRDLPVGAMVTRVGPSPTGFMHIGGLYTALICERLAHQSGGVFYLRIEDTDKKREVEGSAMMIAGSLAHYGIVPDEGQTQTGEERGAYGPYTQSTRASIYAAYIHSLLARGLAYLCFCTHDELEEMRSQQELQRTRTGYYGSWARCRARTPHETLALLAQGTPFVIRFQSNGNFDRKIHVTDVLRGMRELSENDQDIVLMKSDGLPTYHLAHVVDDHLMRTTHVIRGDEWLPSVPLHLQLFDTFGWPAPAYGHIAPIQKMDGASKRKLSKRHDPEASVSFYHEQGYPAEAVVEYLLNLANSNFEDWRKEHPTLDNREFTVSCEKLANPSGGALFDFVKLNDISKNIVATFSADDVYRHGLEWARAYDHDLAARMEQYAEYAHGILGIERGGAKVRKDIAKWSCLRGEMEYFFDDLFVLSADDFFTRLVSMARDDIHAIVDSFIQRYDESDSLDEWFGKIKALATSHGYAESAKTFKADPGRYKGTVADVAKIFRVALTGREQTPDLYSMMQVMGKERVFKRLSILV